MKKIIFSLLTALAAASISYSVYAYSEPAYPAESVIYGDTVYVSDGYFSYQGGNCNVEKFSDRITDITGTGEYASDCFCVYGDRLYFIASDYDTYTQRKLYSCDITGHDMRLIADDVSDYIIADGWIYYQTTGLSGYNYYNGEYIYDSNAIYKVNPASGEWQKLVAGDGYFSIEFCDGDYLYYYNSRDYNDYAVKTDGTVLVGISPDVDEVNNWGSTQKCMGYRTYYIDYNYYDGGTTAELRCRNTNSFGDDFSLMPLTWLTNDQWMNIACISDKYVCLCTYNYQLDTHKYYLIPRF